VVAVGETDWLPLVAAELVQAAEQDEALELDQVSVDDPPEDIVVGLAVNETIGTAAAEL